MKGKRMIFILSLAFVVINMLTGCSTKSVDKEKNQKLIHIEPSSLFKGDAKILEPHLEMMGGAVKISFRGENKCISTMIEIWENGEMKSSRGLGTRYIHEDCFNGEASISLKNDIYDKEAFTMVTAVHGEGYDSHKSFVDKPKEMTYSTSKLNEKMDLPFGKEIAVWGLMGFKKEKTVEISSNNDIEKDAKEADWALVYKIVVDEGEN